MNLTKTQIQTVQKLEHLLGLSLVVKPLRRSVFLVELSPGLETLIRKVCHQYALGRVESNGVSSLAIFQS